MHIRLDFQQPVKSVERLILMFQVLLTSIAVLANVIIRSFVITVSWFSQLSTRGDSKLKENTLHGNNN